MPVPTNPITIKDSGANLPGGLSSFGTFVPSNGALYSVINYDDPGTFTTEVAVFKSIDAGATWTAQDTSNQPTTNNAFNATLAGDMLVMLSSDSDTNVNFYLFDTSTDTFGTTVVTDQKYGPQFITIADVPYLDEWVTSPLCGRADGTVILGGITYTRAGAGGMSLDRYLWWRSQYFITDINAGTWTSWAQCGITDGTPLTDTTVFVNCSIDQIIEGNGMVHFIFSEWDGNFNNFTYLDGTLQKLVQQPLANDDTLGSMSDIKSIGSYSEIDEFGQPSTAFPTPTRNRYTVASDGTTVIIAWATSVTTPYEDLTVLVGTSADPISFAETDLTFPDASTDGAGGYGMAALISTSGNYVFAGYFTSAAHFNYWLDSGSGFGASQTIVTSNTLTNWVSDNLTAVWIGAPYNTWGVSGNNIGGAQFWNPLFLGGIVAYRNYAYIGNAPFARS